MKYSVQNYAKALAGALDNPKADKSATAKNFLALVRKNGDEGRLKKILDVAGRLARDSDGIREVTIESARPLAAAQQKMLARLTKPGDAVRHAVNPELVAGVKIIVNGESQFDGSLASKLDKIL